MCTQIHQRTGGANAGGTEELGCTSHPTSPHPTPPPTLSAGAGSLEPRSRHSSYPAGNQEDEEAEEEEPSPFRGRSRSAPPNLWAAQRYGRELRRMSDEFDGSFKVSAARRRGGLVPEHAGTCTPGHLPLGCPVRIPQHAGTCSLGTRSFPSPRTCWDL